MSKVIEVKSCRECPLKTEINGWDYCGLNKDIYSVYLPNNKVDENCPLKKEQVTVKQKLRR